MSSQPSSYQAALQREFFDDDESSVASFDYEDDSVVAEEFLMYACYDTNDNVNFSLQGSSSSDLSTQDAAVEQQDGSFIEDLITRQIVGNNRREASLMLNKKQDINTSKSFSKQDAKSARKTKSNNNKNSIIIEFSCN